VCLRREEVGVYLRLTDRKPVPVRSHQPDGPSLPGLEQQPVQVVPHVLLRHGEVGPLYDLSQALRR